MAKLEKYQMYIGGEWTDPASGEWFESINPFTGKPWALFARGNAEDAGRAVAAAKKALNLPQWRDLTATGRGHLLRRLGDLIAENADRLAEIEVKDNGKLIAEMSMQLKYVPQWYYYFAGLGPEAGDHVDDALGKARFLDQLDEFEGRGGGELARFQHHCIARR